MSYTQRRRFLWALFLIGVVLIAIAASATTLARLSFADLAQQSTAVARLRCLDAKTLWDRGEIWTETRFALVQSEKGAPGPILTVRTLGGRIGHLHSFVDEVPGFQSGEEVYLFLWAREGGPYRVLGWSQGTFRIARDPQTGIETVSQDSAGAPIFDTQSRTFQRNGIRNLPVAAFREKLCSALSARNK
jgi:hypothetical protein